MINKLILQGRLTHSVEVKQTQSGVSRCNFTIAWSEKRGENEQLLFLNCTAWRGTADLLGKYFSKGQEIAVEGQLVQRKYTGRDGSEHTVIEMPTVDRVHFCGSKQSGTSGIGGHGDGITDPVTQMEPVDYDEELPF